MQFREAIDRDVRDLWDLAGRIAASTGESRVMADLQAHLPDRSKDFAAQEGALEGAAWALRRSTAIKPVRAGRKAAGALST